MITFDHVTITYTARLEPALTDVDLHIGEGHLALVIGETGSGKSTLLKSVNGLVPHFSGGVLAGRVVVDGRSTAEARPRDLADVVGYVGQDPDATFVADVVEDELAYSMENLGIDPPAMRRRVEDVLDVLNLHPLRQRPIATLSGGQRQRVAIGAALTAAPRILVLDEPTSSLDPVSAEEVLAVLSRLVHDHGVTVLVAEHRLERIVHAADLVVSLPGSRKGVAADATPRVLAGPPPEVLALSSIAPPIVRLGRLLGWSPLPLSVRDARLRAAPLRSRLGSPDGSLPSTGERAASVHRLTSVLGGAPVLLDVNLDIRVGEVLALMGRNGAGKSTLLSHLAGLRRPTSGDVVVAGTKPSSLSPREAVRRVGLVPQDPGALLDGESVAAECKATDSDSGLVPGTTRELVDQLLGGLDDEVHPRDLSEGQRLVLALAVILAPAPPLVLLDEPTRGLDYTAKARLVSIVRALAVEAGHAVVVATHDVELAAEIADRVVVLADGEVITDGPVRDVLSDSPGLAPQVGRIFAPLRFLTTTEVARALS
ncbi:MAG: ABC transporter ATP-binding protein [Acidimicrobiales bacterium]